MKNFLIFSSILFLIMLAVKIYSGPINKPSNLPAPGPVAYSYLDVKGLNGIDYSLQIIPKNISNYLKNKSDYKDFLDRKLVIYATGTSCPYARALEKKIKTLRPLYEGKYNYYAVNYSGGGIRKTFDNMEDGHAYLDFVKICPQFCVVNPYNNQVFSIKGIETKEIIMLEDIFRRLDNW